jgi:uroporphyrinogen decarboxylase
VTITAAEILGIDAAIIFADLLLPLEVMGLPFHFREAGHRRAGRNKEDIANLRTDRASETRLCFRSRGPGRQHFGDRLPVIGYWALPLRSPAT